MLKSQILEKLHKKHNNLSFEDIDDLFEIFIKKMQKANFKIIKIKKYLGGIANLYIAAKI